MDQLIINAGTTAKIISAIKEILSQEYGNGIADIASLKFDLNITDDFRRQINGQSSNKSIENKESALKDADIELLRRCNGHLQCSYDHQTGATVCVCVPD